MSLFENDQYRWRETYFVLFHNQDRPSAEHARQALVDLGARFQVSQVQHDAQGQFESLMLMSPDDFAAMDITFVSGDDAVDQFDELMQDVMVEQLTPEEKQKWERMKTCDARFDVYHFERVDSLVEEDDDSMLDPGALLIVLQALASLCNGIGVDPQTGTIV